MAQKVKNLPVMRETLIQSPGQKHTLKKGMATHSSIFFFFQYSWLENPMDRGAWQAAVHGVKRVRHGWATNTDTQNKPKWSLKWRPWYKP